MTNNLNNFLEEETQLFENRYKDISTQIKSYGEYCDVRDFNTQSNKRIVNKALDLVEKEVYRKLTSLSTTKIDYLDKVVLQNTRDELSTIIKQLRV